MPLGMEVGRSPGDFVLDGDQAPPQKGGGAPNFWPMSIVAKQLHGSRCQKGGGAPLPSLRPMTCGQMAGWIKMALGMEVGLGPGQIVLDRDQLRSPKKGQSPPIFGSFLLWPNS